MNPYLVALSKPAIVCLGLGVVQFVQDYQTTGKVVPSLIDGLGVAAKTALAWAGYNGLVLGAQKAQAQVAPKTIATGGAVNIPAGGPK